MYHISNINTLKSICYVYLHYIIKYGTIFWSNSFNSGKIFTLQTKIIRIMTGAQPRTSCRNLFKQTGSFCSMPLYTFINKLHQEIKKYFKHICPYIILIQGKSIIFKDKRPTYLTFQKSKFYTGIKIFNSLPPDVHTSRMTREDFKQP